MDYDEYVKDGWAILQYDDTILDTIDRVNEQLKPHDLFVEMANDECDGFQPIKVRARYPPLDDN